MQTKTTKSLGLEVPIQVPATIEEYASLGGDALGDAIDHVIAHSYLTDFRDRFCERLENFTEVKRATKPGNKKKDGTLGEDVWAESEGKYVDRVLAETETEIEAYQELVAIAQAGGYTPAGASKPLDALVFDPKASEGGSAGPKVPAKTYLNAAQQVIDAGNATVVAANLSKILSREVTPEKESIAGAIRDAENLEKKQLANKYA